MVTLILIHSTGHDDNLFALDDAINSGEAAVRIALAPVNIEQVWIDAAHD